MAREASNCPQCGAVKFFEGLCVRCREENKKKEVLAFSDSEIQAEVSKICEEIRQKQALKYTRQIFDLLFHLRNIDTTEIARIAFENNCWYPRNIYKNAPPEVVSSMIKMLLDDGTYPKTANDIMNCLSVHGGKEVLNAFIECEKHPREWRKRLHINPSIYAYAGGWSFDSDYNYIKKIFDDGCYPIINGTNEQKAVSPVKIGELTDDICSACGCRIVNLIEFDGRDKSLSFIGVDGVIKAKCCPNCAIHCISRYSINGESEIISFESSTDESYTTDDDLDNLKNNTLVLSTKAENPQFAGYWGGGSSVGGFAGWIQDTEILSCPDCNKPMKYLAQIECDTILDNMEGNFYIEICTDCKIMAVVHQQT